jgi:hypothetical protein
MWKRPLGSSSSLPHSIKLVTTSGVTLWDKHQPDDRARAGSLSNFIHQHSTRTSEQPDHRDVAAEYAEGGAVLGRGAVEDRLQNRGTSARFKPQCSRGGARLASQGCRPTAYLTRSDIVRGFLRRPYCGSPPRTSSILDRKAVQHSWAALQF